MSVVFQGVFRKLALALQDIVALRREHEQKVHNAINLEPWTGQIAKGIATNVTKAMAFELQRMLLFGACELETCTIWT